MIPHQVCRLKISLYYFVAYVFCFSKPGALPFFSQDCYTGKYKDHCIVMHLLGVLGGNRKRQVQPIWKMVSSTLCCDKCVVNGNILWCVGRQVIRVSGRRELQCCVCVMSFYFALVSSCRNAQANTSALKEPKWRPTDGWASIANSWPGWESWRMISSFRRMIDLLHLSCKQGCGSLQKGRLVSWISRDQCD